MKGSRFSDNQILAILKKTENGSPVQELCREQGMSSATFYKWRAKYGGMDASMMARRGVEHWTKPKERNKAAGENSGRLSQRRPSNMGLRCFEWEEKS